MAAMEHYYLYQIRVNKSNNYMFECTSNYDEYGYQKHEYFNLTNILQIKVQTASRVFNIN